MTIVKKIKSFFSTTRLFTLVLMLTSALYMPTLVGMGPEADISAQEIEALEQELEKIKSLPPEEQEKIYQDMYEEMMSSLTPEERAEVEAATERLKVAVEAAGGEEALNKMSPEELEKFFESVFAEEKPAAMPVEPKPAVEKKEVEKEEIKKITSKHEKALVLIDSIIEHTQSFLQKMKGIPEIAEQVQKWSKKKKIGAWDPSLKWDSIKGSIEILNQKLQKIKDRDPKTKAFKYLDDLIEDKELYANLSTLHEALKKFEPSIEIEAFGLKKIGKRIKENIQKALSNYAEAITKQKVIESLDKIIEKYEPRAKLLREKEEAAKKKAEEEARKPRVPAPRVAAGRPEEPPYAFPPTPEFRPAAYPPYRPVERPAITPIKPEEPIKPKPEKKEPEKDKELVKAAEKAKAKEEENIKAMIDEIRSDIQKVESMVERSAALVNIKTHITDATQPVDPNLNLRIIIRKIDNPKGGIIQSIESLKKKVAKAPLKDRQDYKKQLWDAYNRSADTLDDVNEQIKVIKADWNRIQQAVSDQKKAAYIDVPLYGLHDLQRAIDKLKETIDRFAPKS